MLKKSLSVLIGLSTLIAIPAEAASKRYQAGPPVMVADNLTQPWVVQLAGAPQPGVYSSKRIVQRPMLFQNGRTRTVIAYQAGVPGVARPRGLFGEFGARRSLQQAQPVAFAPARNPARAAQHRPIDPMYLPQTVAYETKEKPGTIVIDTTNRFLYLVTGNGEARRYGVGVGKPGFEWKGAHKITRKQEWPTWNPPSEMRAREAAKGHILPVSMEGGEENPLGARAMYLGSTLYRIHGTNAPWTIGFAVSSGCIRLRNQDVTDLYERVKVGTRVIVM